MAPRRPSHLDVPPAASSSEEEDETSSEGEEEEDEASQDMEAQPTPKPPIFSKQTDHSDSDDESSSESEPDESPVKPIASKPMEDKKGRSRPSVVATPEKKSAAKRPREAEDSKKQAKKKSGVEAEEEKSGGGDDSKKLFQRFWSEEDEIIVLKGMIEHASKKGAGPASDINAFHNFIKKSLHAEASKSQLMDKIRRLKKKYENNVKRNSYNPTKPHEQKAFELSKKIWGSNGGAEPKSNKATTAARSGQKSNGKTLHASPAVLKEGSRKAGLDRKASISASANEMIGFCVKSLPEHVLKKGLDLIPKSRKAELDEKWKKLHIDELELLAKKHQLISEVLEKLRGMVEV